MTAKVTTLEEEEEENLKCKEKSIRTIINIKRHQIMKGEEDEEEEEVKVVGGEEAVVAILFTSLNSQNSNQ